MLLDHGEEGLCSRRKAVHASSIHLACIASESGHLQSIQFAAVLSSASPISFLSVRNGSGVFLFSCFPALLQILIFLSLSFVGIWGKREGGRVFVSSGAEIK